MKRRTAAEKYGDPSGQALAALVHVLLLQIMVLAFMAGFAIGAPSGWGFAKLFDAPQTIIQGHPYGR